MNTFSQTLQTLRKIQKMSMQALAEKAQVSKSTICKIERNEVQPSLDVAGRLALALGSTLSEMLHNNQEPHVIFLPAKEQPVWEDNQQIKRQNISPASQANIEWLKIELPSDTKISKPATPPNVEKYFLAFEGVLTVKLGQQKFELYPGDSLFFDGSSEHELINRTDETIVYYLVIKHR